MSIVQPMPMLLSRAEKKMLRNRCSVYSQRQWELGSVVMPSGRPCLSEPAVSSYTRRVGSTLRDPAFVVWASCIMLVHLGSMTPIVHLVQRGLDTGQRRSSVTQAVCNARSGGGGGGHRSYAIAARDGSIQGNCTLSAFNLISIIMCCGHTVAVDIRSILKMLLHVP